jgi:hypothetical protein
MTAVHFSLPNGIIIQKQELIAERFMKTKIVIVLALTDD